MIKYSGVLGVNENFEITIYLTYEALSYPKLTML